MTRILLSVFFSTWRWWLLAALVFGGMKFVRADEGDKIRAALDENFAAYNAEDVPRMMKSLSPTLPSRNEFAQQSAKLFADTDSYISVREFELLEVRGQYATARVVQATRTAQDAPEPTAAEAYYRENSKLLPSDEEVEYVQAFKKERGKWRLWLVMTQPKPYVKSDCPNGNCSFPRVRVAD
jgi:hypothetical protein